MPASACSISHEALSELFLRHYHRVDNTTFGGATAESVHALNKKFLTDVWTITNRLTASVVKDALKRAWPALEPYQVKQICSLLPETFQMLRKKAANYKTGERLPKFYGDIFSPPAKPKRRARGKLSPEKMQIESLYGLGSTAPSSDVDQSPRRLECSPAPASSIEAMYGLPSHDISAPIDVASSQEPATQKQKPQASLPSWWNACLGTMELQDPSSGKTIQAETGLGVDGFLVARWPDGSVTQTEVSNLAKMHAEQPAPVNVPAAPIRRPAAASRLARPAAASMARPASALKRPAAVVAEPLSAPCTPPTRPFIHSDSPVQPSIGIFPPVK